MLWLVLPYLCVVSTAFPVSAKPPNPTAESSDSEQKPATGDAYPRRLPATELDNLVAVHPQVISGGVPNGSAAFAELQSLGIRTVISVDGVKPDVALASQYGLRYVHLPHGYDGIPAKRISELTKAVYQLPGPIYIHCHHGQHRSPAAAAAACVTAGWIDQASAKKVLTLAGTSRHYRGLHEAVAAARPLSPASLREPGVDFPETADVPEMVDAMVAIDHACQRLAKSAAADWQAPADHPDFNPAHEALMLREHLVELTRRAAARAEPLALQRMFTRSSETAAALEAALRATAGKESASARRAERDLRFVQLTQSCLDCHRKFRDNYDADSEESPVATGEP